MKPTWIFNFLKKDSIESFFDTYWTAVNNATNSNNPRRFYITDCFSEQFDIDKVLENEARKITTRIGNNKPLIESWKKNDTSLNLIFVGDITNTETQRHMHILATKLRSLLLDSLTQWTTADVKCFALLWRPESAGVISITDESKMFLNELHSLMSLDINHRPFHKVLFFESSDSDNEKNEIITSMSLATLKLSTHSIYGTNDILSNEENSLYLNVGCSSVFYEKEVINDQDAYLLSKSIYDKLKKGNDDLFFYDPQEAQTIIDKNTAFLNSFSSETIYNNIKKECSAPPTEKDIYGVVCDIHPLRSKLKEVWNIYYNKYVVNLKKDLEYLLSKGGFFNVKED